VAPADRGVISRRAADRGAAWEEQFQKLTSEQRRELLAVASSQGIVYAHQIPPTSNGVALPAVRAELALLFNGQTETVEAVRAKETAVRDAELDAAQRSAVARSLAAPDVCLIQGLPGTGKSRVVAEIVTQTVARGERVLLLARHAAAVDRVLELLGPTVPPVSLRLLADDERAEQLPPDSRALTSAERARNLHARSLQAAREAGETQAQETRRLRQAEPVWDRLREIADRLELLRVQADALAARLTELPSQVEGEADAAADGARSAFAAAFHEFARAFGETTAGIERSRAHKLEEAAACRREEADLAARLDALRPLAKAWEARRWWTAAWWRARRRRHEVAGLADGENRLEELRAACAEAELDCENVLQERADAERSFAAERDRRLSAEVTRRQTEFQDELTALDRERTVLCEKWHSTAAPLADLGLPAPALGRAGIDTARSEWQARLQRAEQRQRLAQQWGTFLHESNPWSECLPGWASLVAATVRGLAGGADTAAAGPDFDLLILDEADQFTQAEFAQLARRARRCTLVGAGTEPQRERDGGAHDFFGRLWRRLHWEPTQLPYAWFEDQGRLCCRLRPVPAEHRPRLETESLADFPDIQLRILSLPDSPPALAEVVFPPSLSLADAKGFIYKELEELAVQADGRCVSWLEEPRRLVFRMGPEPAGCPDHAPGSPGATTVVLEPGVREYAQVPHAGAGQHGDSFGRTCCLEFDRGAGWDWPRAEEWVRRRLGARDLGRTARLDTPHRMKPALSRIVSDLLFDGAYRRPVDPGRPAGPPVVEFIPVPALRAHGLGERNPSGSAPSAPLPRKGGAGLEIDLGDPRQRSRLPADVLPGVPAQGLVNHVEALAVVQELEELVSGMGSRVPAADHPTVAVTALTPAQVGLIRMLAGRVPALAGAPVNVVIDVPEALREREFTSVLVSLTRSHAHRPLTYGEGLATLTLALTRARERLILAGDPGSLVRRSQWSGPLEHLDEAAAAREREFVTRLVQYLEGRGAHPAAFRLREGTGA
jgi:hypothetical protein